ncbi:MAG: DNA polymerase III subunit epsilon, partial [Acinetobacter sp.]
AEILADVYLAMTGGQVSFDMDAISAHTEQGQGNVIRQKLELDLPVIAPSDEELEAHENWVKQYQEKYGEACIFAK